MYLIKITHEDDSTNIIQKRVGIKKYSSYITILYGQGEG